MDEDTIKNFEDLATWENELCIFAPERCLIYYSPDPIFLPGRTTAMEPVRQEDYWKCIVRGIEHTIAIRTALQVIQSNTTRELDKVPLLTKKITDGSISIEDEQYILHMADEVSNTFNMLPTLREILIPTSAFRASYAVNKFSYLNNVLHLRDIQEHIERNVDELVIFLNKFTCVQLQAEIQRSELAIGIIGVLIATVALLAAGPSFLQDFHTFFIEGIGWPKWSSFVVFFTFLTVLIMTSSYLLFGLRRRLLKLQKGLKSMEMHP